MTNQDLWQEYREECCPDESGEALWLQHMAFMAGMAAVMDVVINRPSCFVELRESLLHWVAVREAESN